MALVITAARGRVVVVDEPNVPATIQALTVDGWKDAASMSAVITRCMVSQQGNFQFLHTLGNFIYVYVFGDRMGQMGLSGLAFSNLVVNPESCDGNQKQGVTQVLQYYQDNRIAKRDTPVKVTLGTGPTLQGFLTDGSVDLTEAYDLMWQFDFKFSLIPPQD